MNRFLFFNSTHCVKSIQIRSYFWAVFSCIRTRNNSVFGHFSRSDPLSTQVAHVFIMCKLIQKCVFQQNFHTQKLCEILVFHSVYVFPTKEQSINQTLFLTYVSSCLINLKSLHFKESQRCLLQLNFDYNQLSD